MMELPSREHLERASELDFERERIMERRSMLGLLGAGATGLFAAGSALARTPGGELKEDSHAKCLKECQDCSAECNRAYHHLSAAERQENAEHAKARQLVDDCARFCELSAAMVARRSPMMALSCQACAEACKSCASACERINTKEMKACVESCRSCEASCREMATAMGARA